MSNSFTTLDSTTLEHVTGALDLSPVGRIVGKGAEWGAATAAVTTPVGAGAGAVIGAFGGPATAGAGFLLGGKVGLYGGLAGGFTAGAIRQGYKEITGR